MKRIVSVMALVALMAVMIAVTATSAFATPIPLEALRGVSTAQLNGAPLQVGTSCSGSECFASIEPSV
jgi:hypothetical protein